MAARVTRRSSSRAASSSDSSTRPVGSATAFAEPHEFRRVERTLIKLLDDMRRRRLAAHLLPLLNNFDTAVTKAADWRCRFLALSHDELGVIVDGLADPLQPGIAIALSSTCKGLRKPLQAALEVLKERYVRVLALCSRVHKAYAPCTCALLRDVEELSWNIPDLNAVDMATLGMILSTNGLPELREIHLVHNHLGEAGMHALCEGLGPRSFPSLVSLSVSNCNIGPTGAEILAAALGRGAMPKLEKVYLGANGIGDLGVAALVPSLRKMPALRYVDLASCGIGDKGVASLVDNHGKEDFKKLSDLELEDNLITDVGCATLVAALKAGALPAIESLFDHDAVDLITQAIDQASEAACAALDAALEKRRAEREAEAAPQ